MGTKLRLACGLAALALLAGARAQQLDNPATFPVTLYGEAIISTSPAEFHIGSGGQLPGLPPEGAWNMASAVGGTHFYSNVYTANLVPGKNYSVTVTSTNCSPVWVHAQAQNAVVYLGPPMTQLAQQESLTLGSNYSFILRIELINDLTGSLAGQRGGACSSFPEDKPIWYVGLGSLRNGRFAGAVGFRRPAITSDLYTTAALVYDPIDSSEVSVTRDGSGYISQVQSGAVRLKMTTLSSTKYKIDCSLPETPTTVFLTYTVSQYTGPGGGLRIDKLEDGVNWSTVLQSSASSPQWTLYDWRVTAASANLDTTNPITTAASGSTSNVTYGTGTGTNIRKKQKIFAGGELSALTWGSGEPSAPTNSFTYYPDSTGTGWQSQIQSRIEPTGKWVKYDYYNDTAELKAGEIRKVYRPWLTGPTLPSSAADSTCYVETYDYVPNATNPADATGVVPSSRVVTIQGVSAGQTTWSYDWSYASANGHTLDRVTQKDYSSSSAFLTTVTLKYQEANEANTFFRGRVHAVAKPDGTKDAYAYFNGSWDVANNLFSVNAAAGARQVLVFHGHSSTATGRTSLSSWNGWALDTVYLRSNLSTVSETIIDVHGRVVRNTEYVFVNATTIEPISQTTHIFNAGGLPQKDKDYIRSITGGEIATTYGYTAGLLTSKFDIDGSQTTWAYDNWLRNTSITTAANSIDANYPAKAQSFTYYSSGLRQTAQDCSCSPVTTTYVYDTAGRITILKEPKPSTAGNTSGTLDTTFDYTTTLETTVTLPNGATKITDLLLDGHVADEIGTGQAPVYYAYTLASGGTGNLVRTVKHDASGQVHGWFEETTDWFGRTIRQRSPQVGWTAGNLAVRKDFTFHSTTGQLSSYSTTDDSNGSALLPTHAYVYGDLGLLIKEGDDLGSVGLVDASNDRITTYGYAYAKVSGSWLFTKTTQVLRTLGNGSNVATTTVQSRQTAFSNTGLAAGSVVIADTTTTDPSGRTINILDYVQSSARSRTRATTLAGATNQGLLVWQEGYLKSEKSTTGAIRTYSYQEDGQLAGITDGANSATESSVNYAYYAGTKFRWKVSQSTDGSTGVASTEYLYTWNSSAKTTTVQTKFDGHNSYTESNALGLPIHIWGDGAQPTKIDYDADNLGRRTKLTTWQSGTFTGTTWPAPSGGNATTWTLDNATGAITKKTYADLSHVDFTYNARGQLATRKWARTPSITTTYTYYGDAGVTGDATGELQKIDYSDGTPVVTYTCTRVGTPATIVDAAGTRTFAYRSDLQLNTETLGTFYGSKVMTSIYDPSFARPAGWNFNSAAATATLGYDTVSGRPNSVAGALGATAIAFSLAYDPDSRADWVKTITSTTSGTTFKRETPLRAGYGVLASAKTTWNTSTTLGDFSAGYVTTTARRSGQTTTTSTYATQLGLGGATATYGYDAYGRLNSSASTHAGSDVTWGYDLAGNRTSESDDTGFAATTYTPNALNEYASITGGRQEPGLLYDADGNLKQDGTWTYSYDGENRLIQMTKSGQTLTFVYDYLGRRIRKTVTGTNALDTKFLWSGWNLAAEVSAADGFTVNRTFVWGPDFSNAQGQAGGAGALLAQIDATTGVGYAITDTFGSATGYFTGSGTTATLKLAVEYTAYGKGLAAYTAAGASLFQYPIGYHGHYMDWETGLAYYGLRYYQPKHGRFINRDPIEEAGGNNLYAFVGNMPVNGWDVLGLCQNVWTDNADPATGGKWTNSCNDDPFTTHLSGLALGYWLAHTLTDWGGRYFATPSQVTNGSFNKPLTRQKAPNKALNDCYSAARAAHGADTAKLGQIGETRVESLLGSLAAQRSAVNWGLAESIATTFRDTSLVVAGTYAVGWAAGATQYARIAASGRALYATARNWQEVNAIASTVAAYQTQANILNNVAGIGVSLGYGIGIASNLRDASINTGTTFIDAAMGFRFSQTGAAFGLTQAALNYVNDLGLSDSQVAGVLGGIGQSIAQTQTKLDGRLQTALSECDKKFK